MISSKLPYTGTTIFSIMSALATQYNAINLSQGFPGFQVSAELIELINKYMVKGHNQYAPMPGILPLREIIAAKVTKMYGCTYHPDTEITITSGATQALFTAIMCCINQGDEAIIFEPAYDSYAPAIKLAGGTPIYISLTPPHFTIDWNTVKEKINTRTKLIIINTPGNPSTKVLMQDDYVQLIKLVKDTNILIISDEVYEHIAFDPLNHICIAEFEELKKRSFLVYSFGKTFHATGWKMGYVLAPSALTQEFRAVHQFNVFSANTPIQYALAEYMSNEKNYVGIERFYAEKRDYFLKLISPSRFNALPCSGSYFQLLSYENMTDENDKEFAIRMTKEIGVASIPVSAFYANGNDYKILRFCFAKENSVLEQAAQQLCKI